MSLGDFLRMGVIRREEFSYEIDNRNAYHSLVLFICGHTTRLDLVLFGLLGVVDY